MHVFQVTWYSAKQGLHTHILKFSNSLSFGPVGELFSFDGPLSFFFQDYAPAKGEYYVT